MNVVDTENLIKNDAGCKELLIEAMRYHLCPEQRHVLASDRTRDRKPDGTRPYIFAVGKYTICNCQSVPSLIAVGRLVPILILTDLYEFRWWKFICNS